MRFWPKKKSSRKGEMTMQRITAIDPQAAPGTARVALPLGVAIMPRSPFSEKTRNAVHFVVPHTSSR
jgi:hypothetical protein